MFTAASKRQFDVLLFWALDRLSREGCLETLQHLQRLTSHGVAWRSFTEQYLDSTGVFREAVISILAAVAKQERVRLSALVNTVARVMTTRELCETRQKGQRRPVQEKCSSLSQAMKHALVSFDGKSKKGAYLLPVLRDCGSTDFWPAYVQS